MSTHNLPRYSQRLRDALVLRSVAQFDETPDPLEAIRTEFAGLDDAGLNTEYERIRTRGQELAARTDLTDEEAAELSELATRSPVLVAEMDARTARAAEAQAQRDAFSAMPERTVPVVTAVQLSTEAAPVATDPASQTPAEGVQASPAVAVPSVSQLAAQTPVTPPATASGGIVTAHVLAPAAGFVGKAADAEFDGTREISQALIKNAQSFGRRGAPGTRQAIAQFRRNRGPELTIDTDDPNTVMEKVNHARNERRLHGGSLAKAWQHYVDQGASLTAAAGWCAPSENDYDLCRQWSAGVGLLDLPTVTTTRGGINYTDDIDFSVIYANAVAAGGGFNFLTEAEVIADTAKTCSEIPCPTFENRRLDVAALCIRVSFLQAAGYPEVVNTWQDGLLTAQEQEINRLIIADILARAGAATVIPGTGPDPDGDSFTSALLAGVELAAEDIRYRYMMAWTETVEIVLPHWVLLQIRADLSRRNGVDMLAVSDSEIAAMFSVRNVRVQFVRGWQDGLITGGALAATFPGGDAATPFMTALPSTVSFLAYPAGSIAVARQDVVTLTNVYDAASLAVNEFTALFAEEGFAPIYPCPGQRLYTVTGCVGGISGAAQINCADDTP